MPEKTTKERITEELNRISRFYKDIAENQREIISPLLQNAAFMKVTLEDLQEIIATEGVTDTYQNGANQYGTKQSATLQSYNSLIKNYASVIKTLSQLLPPETKRSAFLDFLDFQERPKSPEELEAERQREEEHQRKLKAELNRAMEIQRQRREREHNNT